MSAKPVIKKAIPTNLITGFLGVGKTSTIMQLVEQKPANERWAILVNEFGEIGVDGALLAGQVAKEQDVFIREVPGGCMCCASGVPMQVALNQLLKQASPDRLLIEPTGLGHPKEVLEVLSNNHYKQVLALQQTLTLVDARNFSDSRYTDHEIFNQQIAIADTIVANKVDLYEAIDRSNCERYIKQVGKPEVKLVFAEYGNIALEQLMGATSTASVSARHSLINHHPISSPQLIEDRALPECGYIRADNRGQGYQSVGWRFASDKVFDHLKLARFLKGLSVKRLKATFITDIGNLGYNFTSDTLSEIKLAACAESRIEIISDKLDNTIEANLFDCLINSSS